MNAVYGLIVLGNEANMVLWNAGDHSPNNVASQLWRLKTWKFKKTTVFVYEHYCWVLYTWVRASWIEFNNFPTRYDLFSLLHFCRQLYMFQVLTPIIRSSYNCNYSFWYWLTGSATICSRCWVGTDSCLSYGRYSFVWIPTVRYQINRIYYHLLSLLSWNWFMCIVR